MAFINEDFLLQTESARVLYHQYAKRMPIIDYHTHLSPQLIADNHKFKSISELWLGGDHYKWRAMRTNGVSEEYITGGKSDREKFKAWASTVPHTLRNPLFHWTYLELKDPFGITDVTLEESTADAVFDRLNGMLTQDSFTTQSLLEHFNVKVVCTTDDPADSLEFHKKHAMNKNSKVLMLPAWRPDKARQIGSARNYITWVNKLGEAANQDISTFDHFLLALRKRHQFFHDTGCRISDHGLECFYSAEFTDETLSRIFGKALAGKEITAGEEAAFHMGMLYHFALMDQEKGWAQQYHFGAIRNNSSRMVAKLGPDTGFDSIGDLPTAKALAAFLDSLDRDDKLAKTILYNLNPAFNEMVATMIGNFQDGSCPGKLQFGSAWWFLDQKQGMEAQINALSNMGLLSRFVGMLTDSRCFISYSRHEYFRRILCNLFGEDIQKGLLPNDLEAIGKIVQDICYNNANSYFGFSPFLD